MKKFLSFVFGVLWIVTLPICIVAITPICLFANFTVIDFLSFWGLCVITLLSGKGFDDWGEEDEEYYD